MKTMKAIPRGLLLLALAATLGACSTIAHYNPIAYQNATSLKVEFLAVIAKASEPYDGHKAEAEKVQADLDKAYEFAKGLPKNQVVTKQWTIIRDPKGKSAGGALAMWKEQKTMSADFVKEFGAKASEHFDQLITLEGAKIQ